MLLPPAIFALMAALANLVFAAAGAPNFNNGEHLEHGHTPPPLNQAITSNLSYLFGWQFAGAAVSQDELWSACEDFSSVSHGQWKSIGLNSGYISEPICNSSHTSPNATASISPIIEYSTQIFLTQLLGSFSHQDSGESADISEHLCSNIRFNHLDAFMLTSTTILSHVCRASGRQLPPRPFGPGRRPTINESAVYATNASASMLYGIILASTATTESQLNILCAHAPDHVGNLGAELMNGGVVQSAVCSFKEPVEAGDAKDLIKTWLTRTFITIVMNLGSKKEAWGEWLCENMDFNGMDEVGLGGDLVREEVCGA